MQSILTFKEVQSYLRISRMEVMRLEKKGSLPVIRIPGAISTSPKVSVSTLHAWLKGNSSGQFMTLTEFRAEIKNHLNK